MAFGQDPTDKKEGRGELGEHGGHSKHVAPAFDGEQAPGDD